MLTHARRLARRGLYGVKGFPLYQILDQLQQSQFWSRAQLQALREEKLQRLVRHAYAHVPYYRRIMDERRLVPGDIQKLEDLEKLPILTRKEIRQHAQDLRAPAANLGQERSSRTGGTTGEPLTVWKDLRSVAWGNAAYFRGLSYAGYDFDRDRLAILFGGSLQPAQPIVGRRWSRISQTLLLSAFKLRPDNVRRYREQLIRYGVQFLKGYASSTYLLARFLEEQNCADVELQGVFTTSEHLPDHQRQYIERVFRTRVFDYYGCVEINSLGYECPAHSGYHVPEEHAVVETIRDSGLETDDAGNGAFLITDLDNYSMPLIRYRNGDAGSLVSAPCRCGRTLQRISPLLGRIADMLRSTDGAIVPGGIVSYVMRDTRFIREYCLTQEDFKRCRLQFVADDAGSEIPGVVDVLRRYLGDDMEIDAERVEQIPLTGAGKRNFTRCRIAQL